MLESAAAAERERRRRLRSNRPSAIATAATINAGVRLLPFVDGGNVSAGFAARRWCFLARCFCKSRAFAAVWARSLCRWRAAFPLLPEIR
jgi:hypothetical protein